MESNSDFLFKSFLLYEKYTFKVYHYIFFYNFRSPYVTREARTLADKPEMPPNMTLGSFEAVSHDIQKRTVYVYWRQIPDYNRNGPNFRYTITEVIRVHSKIKTKACFIYFDTEISVMGHTEISIMECTDRNFCTPHYINILRKADETSQFRENIYLRYISD